MKQTHSFAILLAFLFVTGCAVLSPNADPFVVRVEQTQSLASGTVDLVLHLDNQDRGFWRTNAPAFHNFCDWLRTPIPYNAPAGVTNVPRAIAVQLNVSDLKHAYQAEKTAGNSNALYLSWSVLSAILGQANSWSNIVTHPIR